MEPNSDPVVTNQYDYFNDPSWMNFEGPYGNSIKGKLSTVVLAALTNQPAAPGTEMETQLEPQLTASTVTAASVPQNMLPMPTEDLPNSIVDGPIYPPQMTPPNRPYPQRGYRRGNTISSYHQPCSAPRYPAYPRKYCQGRSDWDDIHLPNYEDFATEFDRPSSSQPSGYQASRYPYHSDRQGYPNSYGQFTQLNPINKHGSWRGVDRRGNPRNISQIIAQTGRPKQAKENYKNISNSEHDYSNNTIMEKAKSTDKDAPPEDSNKSVNALKLALKVTKSNKRDVFEQYDGKVFNTKVLTNNNNIVLQDSDTNVIVETIPLLLNTTKRSNVRSMIPYDHKDKTNEPIVIKHQEKTNTTKDIIDLDIKNDVIDLENTPELDMPFSPRKTIGLPQNKITDIRMNVQLSPSSSLRLSTDRNTASESPLPSTPLSEIGTTHNKGGKIEIRMEDRLSPPAIVLFKNMNTALAIADVELVQPEIIDISDDSNNNADIVILNVNVDKIDGVLGFENDNLDGMEESLSIDSIEDKLRQLTAQEQDQNNKTAVQEDFDEFMKSSTVPSRKNDDQSVPRAKLVTKKRRRSSSTREKSMTDKQPKSLKNDASTIKEIHKNSSSVKEHSSKRHKSSSHSYSKKHENVKEKSKRTHDTNKKKQNSNQKFDSRDCKESKSMNIEEHGHSLGKVNKKRRQSFEPKVIDDNNSNKIKSQRRNSFSNSISTCVAEQHVSNILCSATDSSIIKGVVSTIPNPHYRNLENIMESLRKNDTYLQLLTPEIQSAVNNFDRNDVDSCSAILEKQTTLSEFDNTMLCDNEIDAIMTEATAAVAENPAQIRNNRRETQESQSPYTKQRSKSVDHRNDASTSQVPAKISGRRRTIVDAFELDIPETRKRGRPRSRRGSQCRDRYLDDPDYKTNYVRADMPVRVTRSKSREMTRCVSTDTCILDDNDFYQQSTPPATPKTPRVGDKTPEILRTLQMKSNVTPNSRTGLEYEAVPQNHVYAPTLFNQCDFLARINDPRLNRSSAVPATKEDDEDISIIVDEITLQNTLANKVAPPSIQDDTNTISHAIISTNISPNTVISSETSQMHASLCRGPTPVLKIPKLTDEEIQELKKNISRKSRRSKDERAHKLDIAYYNSQQEKNTITCSIAKAFIEKISESDKEKKIMCNTVSVLDNIMKQMDAHVPRTIKDDVPRIRKSVDQLDNNTLSVDNAMTKPLSNKPLKQIATQKSFDTFATVSTESDQSPRPQPTIHESKETKLQRLFGAKARHISQIQKIPRIDNQKSIKKVKTSTDNVPKQKKLVKRHDTFDVRWHTLGSIDFAEESTSLIKGFLMGADIVEAGTSVQESYLHEASRFPSIAVFTLTETIKSIPEILDSPIMNIDDIFGDNDVGSLSINGEPPEVSSELKRESTPITSAAKAYNRPTIIATVDLLAKDEEEESACAQVVPVIVPPIPQDSIVIVPVQEYVLNVISTIGQNVQMEKLHPRFQDMVKKTTNSFTLETTPCDEFVDDFRKAYLLKLGKKFVEYTDSIEIQNFSVALLYTSLTQANLQYNGFKIRKLDVANSICDLYQAVGQEHKRSIFCKQLYQLSLYMKEMEMTAEMERQDNTVQPVTPVGTRNHSPQCQVNATVTPSILVTPAADLNATNPPEVLPSVSSATIVQQNTPSVQNSSNTVGILPESLLPVADMPSRVSATIFHVPVMQTSETQFRTVVSSSQVKTTPQDTVAPLQEMNNFINIAPNTTVSASSFVQQPPQVANTRSSHEPDLCHSVVVSEGRQTVIRPNNVQNKRRIKVTPTLQQQQQQQQQQQKAATAQQFETPTEDQEQWVESTVFTNDMRNLLWNQCQMYNFLINRHHRIVALGTLHHAQSTAVANVPVCSSSTVSTVSNVTNVNARSATIVRQTQSVNISAQTRSLMNFRPDVSNKQQKNASANTPVRIPNAIPPVGNKFIPTSAAAPANPRITVRNIDQLRQQPITLKNLLTNNPQQQQTKSPRTSKNNSQVSQISLPSNPSEVDHCAEVDRLIAELVGTTTQSLIANTNNDQHPTVTMRAVRSASNASNVSNTEEPTQVTDIIARNSSRESSGFCDDSRDSTDFNCVCGKTAEMICSCKLIVYCSEICQGKDWSRHSADHVDA